MTNPWIYPLLPLAGFVAGVVNTIAGGGSFLVLPLLVLLGMPDQIANGTNRIAIALQSLYSVRAYHERRPIDPNAVLPLLLPSLPGLVFGFILATVLSPAAFRNVVGVLFLVFVAFMLAQPRLLLEKRQRATPGPRWVEWGVMFLIGAYAGFLQAGVGLLLLVALSALHGRELVDANGLKLALIAVWIVPTMIWFAATGQVEWIPGLLVGVGNFVGAKVGTSWAVKKGNKLIFTFLVIVMVATGVSMLFT
jgi:uncharacterized membrane protein YfcA